jgi:hypothetical protein
MHALNRTHVLLESEALTSAALHEFATTFRDDVHSAVEFALTENQNHLPGPATAALALQFDGGRAVIYDFNSDVARLRRRVVESEQTIRRDTFAVPRDSQVAWRLPTEGEPALLTVLIARPLGREPNEQRTWRTTRIEAAIGLDHRETP